MTDLRAKIKRLKRLCTISRIVEFRSNGVWMGDQSPHTLLALIAALEKAEEKVEKLNEYALKENRKIIDLQLESVGGMLDRMDQCPECGGGVHAKGCEVEP